MYLHFLWKSTQPTSRCRKSPLPIFGNCTAFLSQQSWQLGEKMWYLGLMFTSLSNIWGGIIHITWKLTNVPSKRDQLLSWRGQLNISLFYWLSLACHPMFFRGTFGNHLKRPFSKGSSKKRYHPSSIITHRIHGTGIFTYMDGWFYGKCREIYHTWIPWVMVHGDRQKLQCRYSSPNVFSCFFQYSTNEITKRLKIASKHPGFKNISVCSNPFYKWFWSGFWVLHPT